MGLSRIRIAIKLPVAFLLLVAVSLTVLGLFSYRSAKDTLVLSARDELTDVATTRAQAFQHWSKSVLADISMQSQSPFVANVLKTYEASWHVLGPEAANVLRQLYVSGNTFPAFERFNLEDAGDGSVYSRAHNRFHSYFLALMRRGSFRDILLIDAAGDIVYTVAKQDDFGMNVSDAYGGAFFDAAKNMLASDKTSSPVFVDLFQYGPSFGRSAFVLNPVYDPQGKKIGLLAYRITTMTIADNLGESAGLGKTGQSFAIGHDGVARTDAKGWNDGDISADSPLQGAIKGRAGTTTDTLSQSFLQDQMTAFAPAKVFDQKWIIIASRSMEEILEPVSAFTDSTIVIGGIILLLAAIIGVAVAMGFTVPLRQMSRAIQSVSDQDYDTPIPHVKRGDEIGHIGRALDELRGRLEASQELTHEMSFKSAALESTSAALMITDANFTITYINGAVKKMMTAQVSEFRRIAPDFDPEKLIGVNMDIFHAKPEQIRALIKGKSLPFRTDIRVGDARIQIELNAVWKDNGEVAGLVVEWVDVTEERRKTAALSAIESGQIMLECDAGGHLVRMNDNFTRLLGAESTVLRGRQFGSMITIEGQNDTQGLIMDTVSKGEAYQGRFTFRRENGEEAIVDGGFYPVLDRRKEITGLILIGSDVTAAQIELRAADARQQAMQKAQQSVVEALRVGLRQISNGDLTVRMNEPFASEYEQLRTDFNDALENLIGAMHDIATETVAMQSETTEIVKAADEMSKRTERQAMTLQETASSLDQVTTNITQTASGSARANEIVIEARARAEESGGVVDEAERAMAEIAASSREIVKVISVIDDISFQTNLLALNAGVEAARAGEAGRGFAVVATEVRALAQRCANAAAEINQLITVSGQHVSRGVELVGVTGETLKTIVSSITDISGYIAEIAQAGKEQSIGLAQVNSAVNQIDHVTQQNAAMFEETTSASHALAQRAHGLAETIGHFNIGKEFDKPKAESPKVAARKERSAAEAPKTKGNLAVANKPVADINDWEDF